MKIQCLPALLALLGLAATTFTGAAVLASLAA
jgi:hypothetical protein